jgi:glycosyltransferase involved in cell wall biosynthesis
MKKLILLTYTFPPLSTGGTSVVLNMSKYLPPAGWEVIVVTVKKPVGMAVDKSLLRELPEKLKVFRIPHGKETARNYTSYGTGSTLRKLASFVSGNYIFVPDRVITWRKKVLPALKQIIADEKPNAIVSFGPHHSLHLIALSAAKETTLPFVPFFGDLWLEDSYVEWPSKLNRIAESFLERKVVSRARGIIATTERSTGYFLEKYEKICPPSHVAENAYDPERTTKAVSPVTDTDHLTAGWTGNFFASHSPDELLAGLTMFYNRNPQSKLRVKMAGDIDSFSANRINTEPLSGKVIHHGHLKWRDVPEFQRNCNVLISYLGPRRGSHYKNSSKTAEYLACGRTILCIAPEGSMTARVRKPGRGYIVQPEAEQIALMFENIEYQWKTSGLRVPLDFAEIERRFSADNVMARLAGFLNKMAGP